MDDLRASDIALPAEAIEAIHACEDCRKTGLETADHEEVQLCIFHHGWCMGWGAAVMQFRVWVQQVEAKMN